ncbi:non-ribosomal peptide synthetase, partial [Virgisporangium aurantiacum]|uniref:non-ribosomal peptide synthetase n=1 Tax=Virgisporangium aurantiacum TaxID=175570 RepID=UPI001952352C
MSFAQERLWFLHQMEPDNAVYNARSTTRLTGQIDVGALERALVDLLARHEALRTRFVTVDGEPRQLIDEITTVPLRHVDLSDLRSDVACARAGDHAAQEALRPFDLSRTPLLRASLLRIAPDDHVLCLVIHHIAIDDWSFGILRRELWEIYRSRVAGEQPQLPALPVQYADFAAWQRDRMNGDLLAEHLRYWRQRLDGLSPLDLPTDRPRPAVQSSAGAATSATIPAETADALRRLARQHNATTFMTMLAAFVTVLARYCQQQDIAVGIPVSGRTTNELANVVGFFVNTLVVRVEVLAGLSFAELLDRVREAALDAFAHQDLPFERLVEELAPRRDRSQSPLVQVLFNFESATPGNQPTKVVGLDLASFAVPWSTSKFDLTLSVADPGAGGGLAVGVEYSTELFDRPTVERLVDGLRAVLDAAAADVDVLVGLLPVMPDAAAERVWAWGEGDRVLHAPVGDPGGPVGLLAGWIATAPGRVAVVDGAGAELTFGGLGDRVVALAGCLRSWGVGPEVRVGVLAGRGVDVVVAILAVWWAGGVCVPLDEEFPDERLGWIADDGGVQVAVTTAALVDRATGWGVPVVMVDQPQHWPGTRSTDARRPVSVDRAGLAYVIYTSGSTGAPRPVGVPWASVDWLLQVAGQLVPAGLVWACSHSLAFDFSVWELWAALAGGGRVVMLPRWMVRSPDQTLAVLAEQHVQVWCQTPSAFAMVAGRLDVDPASVLPDLRWVIFGGEALDPGLLPGWVGADGAPVVVNMYGITETTVHVTQTTITAAAGGGTGRGGSPIGRPLPGVRIRLLDECLQPVPPGVVGDLYVGGAGVARGYLGRPEETARRFVPDPYAGDGSRLYRSGDRGYWHDGRLYYVGRADAQIKIRGYRIEPAEIESTLTTHSGIAAAAVVAEVVRSGVGGSGGTGGGGDVSLTAYLVPVGDGLPTAAEVHRYLAARLPAHMVPSRYLTVTDLPLTPNGKIDRTALARNGHQPLPAVAQPGGQPSTPTEQALASIWAELLDTDSNRLGVDSDFFATGGHSMLAIRLIARISEALDVELPVATVFGAPTLGGLAAAIDTAAAGADT